MILTTREAAEHVRLSETQLERLRQRGDGPPYIKIGRSVRYRDGDIAIWLERHVKTSEVGGDSLISIESIEELAAKLMAEEANDNSVEEF